MKSISINSLWEKSFHIPKSSKDVERLMRLVLYTKLEIIRETHLQEVLLKRTKPKQKTKNVVDHTYDFLNQQRIVCLEKAYMRAMFDLLAYSYIGECMNLLNNEGLWKKQRKGKSNNIEHMDGGGKKSGKSTHLIYLVQFYTFSIFLLNASFSYARSDTIVPTTTAVFQTIQPIRNEIENSSVLKPNEKRLIIYGIDSFLSNVDNISNIYLSKLPEKEGRLQIQHSFHKSDIPLIEEYITLLNTQIYEINSELRNVCHDLSKKFIQNEAEVLEMLFSSEKLQQLHNEARRDVKTPYMTGITPIDEPENIPYLSLDTEGLEDKQRDLITKTQVDELHTQLKEDYLQTLCMYSSPAPYYSLDVASNSYNLFSNHVQYITLHSTFPTPEMLSVLSTSVHGELSIVKRILDEKNALLNSKKMSESDFLRYESLAERLKVFLGILTSSSNFEIGTLELNSVYALKRIEPVFEKTQYALAQYNESVQLLKRPFPKTHEKNREFRLYSESLKSMSDEQTKQYIYEWFRPVKPYTQVAWETSAYIGSSADETLTHVLSSTHTKIKPLMEWLEGLGLRTIDGLKYGALFLFLWYLGKPIGKLLLSCKSSKGAKTKRAKGVVADKKDKAEAPKKRQYTRRKNVAPLTPLEEAHRRARLIEAKYGLTEKVDAPKQSKPVEKKTQKIKKTNE